MSHWGVNYATVGFAIQINMESQVSTPSQSEDVPRARVQISMDIWQLDPHLQNPHHMSTAQQDLQYKSTWSARSTWRWYRLVPITADDTCSITPETDDRWWYLFQQSLDKPTIWHVIFMCKNLKKVKRGFMRGVLTLVSKSFSSSKGMFSHDIV